jgi:hypothetical protein
VMLNPADIREAGLAEGAVVDLISHFEGEERVARRFVVVPYRSRAARPPPTSPKRTSSSPCAASPRKATRPPPSPSSSPCAPAATT